MASRNSTTWMWAQACDLLNEADRLHRQFFHLNASGQTRAVWEPPVDIFEDDHEIILVFALPGVAAERVEISIESGLLTLRAESRLPFAGSRGALRRLEIPYGYFERRIQLSHQPLATATREFRDGCLIVRLSKAQSL